MRLALANLQTVFMHCNPLHSDEKKNVGIIAGAGTLFCFGVILLVLAVYFFYRRKRLKYVYTYR